VVRQHRPPRWGFVPKRALTLAAYGRRIAPAACHLARSAKLQSSPSKCRHLQLTKSGFLQFGCDYPRSIGKQGVHLLREHLEWLRRDGCHHRLSTGRRTNPQQPVGKYTCRHEVTMSILEAPSDSSYFLSIWQYKKGLTSFCNCELSIYFSLIYSGYAWRFP
jgi:hypothetical protein